ncbi:hypothetical protein SKAU_G00025780 [Synaphobranchus kaupii]|uniref:Uncharacterized protein n=1 Tax=Synaphobranchus kaupii TaxID=118154 RepID=A0A9Q1GCS1_SYNKA|nr:hypothetical protein SKAU_G00025780 [Synaphobranchus kaupii]
MATEAATAIHRALKFHGSVGCWRPNAGHPLMAVRKRVQSTTPEERNDHTVLSGPCPGGSVTGPETHGHTCRCTCRLLEQRATLTRLCGPVNRAAAHNTEKRIRRGAAARAPHRSQ